MAQGAHSLVVIHILRSELPSLEEEKDVVSFVVGVLEKGQL